MGQRSPAIDPGDSLRRPARHRRVRDGVRERREAAAPDRGGARAAKGMRGERQAMAIPVAGEELALEPRDVDADRALALAGAALEAEVEHLVNAGVGQLRVAELTGNREAQRVGPATG